MTAKKFWISDSHFSHKGILGFTKDDGSPLRDFPGVESMDDYMIQRWNSVVRPGDIVYHLGDFALNKHAVEKAGYLNGRKTLIMGDHDTFSSRMYLAYFDDIKAAKVITKLSDILMAANMKVLATHIPCHIDSVMRWGFNVHGHLHANEVDDPAYVNVSVEQVDYTPLEHDALISILEDRLAELRDMGF